MRHFHMLFALNVVLVRYGGICKINKGCEKEQKIWDWRKK